MKIIIYNVLTAVIILTSKLRDGLFKSWPLRWDRTLPWPDNQNEKTLLIGCCDCGLAHFIVMGQSITPIRPADYNYRLRFGARAFTSPRPDLGEEARWLFISNGCQLAVAAKEEAGG